MKEKENMNEKIEGSSNPEFSMSKEKDNKYSDELQGDLESVLKPLELSEEDKFQLLKQVKSEYKKSSAELNQRVVVWRKRLKLYNNQMRDTDKVGEPLLFTIFNSLYASLYDDRMSVSWRARTEDDIKVEQNLNDLAEYDYDEMGKDQLDAQQLWDALFYSYGLIDMIGFNAKTKTPSPNVIDPQTFMYDINSDSVDGASNGSGAMGYLGWKLLYSKRTIQGNKFFDSSVLNHLKPYNRTSEDSEDMSLSASEIARMESMGLSTDDINSASVMGGDNTRYEVIQWRTWFNGKRTLVVSDTNFRYVLRSAVIDVDRWMVNAKRLWSISHQFQGVSIPDLTEDKQRWKSVMLNTMIKTVRADLFPMYEYDESNIVNEGDLRFGFNKFIAKKNANTAIQPINKATPNPVLYDSIMNQLDSSAQRATATPELQQGVISKEARTLGELNLVAQKVDTRYSLAVKNLMQGEREFWRMWYMLYKKYFQEGLSDKVIRISGYTNEFRKLNRQNIIAFSDPDVDIESRILSEAQNMRKLQQFILVSNMASQDPTTNRRFILKHVGQLSGMTSDQIDMMMPPTTDEIVARAQNELLSNNQPAEFTVNDNHVVHLEEHRKATDTPATRVHIDAHKQALVAIQKNKALAPEGMVADMGLQSGEVGLPANDSQGLGDQAQRASFGSPSQQANLSM